jgi:hypothetical protein
MAKMTLIVSERFFYAIWIVNRDDMGTISWAIAAKCLDDDPVTESWSATISRFC